MDVLARLDRTRGACNVLEHPFYERWSAGELSAGELSLLRGRVPPRGAGAGGGLAGSGREGRAGIAEGLSAHAEEEAAHVELWDGFARAAGMREAPAGNGPLVADAGVRTGMDGGRGPARAPGGAVRDRGEPAGDRRGRSWRA